MLPSSCMIGFVNGLAIVIFLSQLDHFTTVGFPYTHTCGSSQCLNVCHNVFLLFFYIRALLNLARSEVLKF